MLWLQVVEFVALLKGRDHLHYTPQLHFLLVFVGYQTLGVRIVLGRYNAGIKEEFCEHDMEHIHLLSILWVHSTPLEQVQSNPRNRKTLIINYNQAVPLTTRINVMN